MSLIISSSVHLTGESFESSLAKGHIGYINYVTRTNLTASSEAAGFEVTGLANPLTFERWKPSAMNAQVDIDFGTAKEINYIGMASHTFATVGCVVTAQKSDDGVTYTDIDDVSVGDNKPVMLIFESILTRYVRLVFTGSTPPSLGVLYIGIALTMQREIYGGHTPITMGRKTSRITNKTEGGQYAGSSIITEGVETNFDWQYLTAQWYRDNFEPFVKFARANPFFIAWRNQEYPAEVGYCWTNGDIRPTNMGTADYMQVSMSVSGYSDE